MTAIMTYERDVKGQYQYFDFGFVGGVGYKLKKQIKSTSVGISYYYGLADVSKDGYQKIRNSSLNFWVKIPIGAGKEKDKPES